MKRAFRHPLAIIIVAYFLLGGLYSITLPVFEAPDEQQHYAYVRYMASEGRLPPRGETSGAGHESSQPPLYYAIAALVTNWGDNETGLSLPPNRYYGNYQAPGTINDNKNTLLHTDLETFPWSGSVLKVHIARLVNILFGGLTVGATYWLAYDIFSDQILASAAAATVAFTPQFLFISSAVNNDAAVSAFSTLALWRIVRGLYRGYTPGRSALLGLAIGLAALSKVSSLAILPLALFIVGLHNWFRGSGLSSPRRLVDTVKSWSIVGLTVGAVSGWWYVRNAVLYRDPLGLKTHLDSWWAHKEALNPSQVWHQLSGVEFSFWAAFGMGDIRLPGAFYVIMQLLVYLAGLGLLMWVVRAWRSGQRPGPRAWSLAISALWFLMVLVALLRWMQLVKAELGRLLFPAIGAVAVLLTWGLAQFVSHVSRFAFQARRLMLDISRFAPVGLAAVLFFVSAVSPSVIIKPAYARPPLLSDERIAERILHSFTVHFGDSISLVGYKLEKRSAPPGEEIPVTLCWEARETMSTEYAYFVHFLGSDESIVGRRNTYPGLGRFPTSQWAPGDAFCDTVRVPVEEWTPPQAVYDVEIGWYDPKTDARLPAYDASGVPREMVLLGKIKVAPEDLPVVEVPHRSRCLAPSLLRLDVGLYERGNGRLKVVDEAGDPVDSATVGWLKLAPAEKPTPPSTFTHYQLGEMVSLAGYDLKQANGTLHLALHWTCLAPMTEDYVIFVHLLDSDGDLVAQADGPPINDDYPTSYWASGELIVDERTLHVGELEPGVYQLKVGMYLLETGERLSAVDAAGERLPNDAILLTEIDLP